MNKRFTILLICCCNIIYAQEYIDTSFSGLPEQILPSTGTPSNIASYDTILMIYDIELPADSVESLKRNKAFSYLNNLDSMLKAKQMQDKVSMQRTGSSRVSLFDRLMNTSIVKIFFWAIAIIFIFFLLYNLFISKGIFRKPSPVVHVDEKNAVPDNFTDQDFNKLISQSCRLGDYRMAVRYLFLHTLQRLNERSLIEYAADKTNSKYANEIIPDRKSEFASLVDNYEHIWYGHININKEGYDKVEKKFLSFLNKFPERK